MEKVESSSNGKCDIYLKGEKKTWMERKYPKQSLCMGLRTIQSHTGYEAREHRSKDTFVISW